MSAPAAKAEQPKAPAPALADRSAALQSSARATTSFADNRPAAAAHRQQQALISASPRMQHAAASQALIAQSPRQQAAQLQAVAAPAQRPETPAPVRENKTGLPDKLKAGVENLSGYSLDDVQVHYNSAKPAQLQAHAYAQGTDIHVAPGQEQHLPHEAWHVVQQKQGRVRPTRQLKGKVAVNDDAGLEKEADVMGERALVQRQMRPALGAAGRTSAGIYQFAGEYEGRMARHDTYKDSYEFGDRKTDFTYHHVIPENKIHQVLKKIKSVVDSEDKVKNLKEEIGTHAKSQFVKALVTDTAFYISKEIDDFKTDPVITLSESEAEEVIRAEHGDRILVINGIRNILKSKLSRLETSVDDEVLKQRMNLGEKLLEKGFEEKIAKYAISGIGAEDNFTEGAVWMPGNIHRGPKGSFRLDPKNAKQFLDWQDDGGDKFEKAAANIVSVEHFGKLWKLNAEMNKLIDMPVPDAADEAEVAVFRAQVVEVLELMDAIRKLPTTKFDESQWQAHKEKSGKGIKTDFMRLKKHVPEEDGEKRLEEAAKLT
ncbi:hypothetical protein GCM10022409_18420 [Hymenobacter glaciei]|uniref:eCIS core domain-containing protein n=1 Tax=Hymenobacter glaciei TaxID=877209 RepID=A0ABP7U1E6_9BACT